MEVKGDYNFNLELPEKIILGMKPIELPPNMRIRYEDYLEKQEDKDSKAFQTLKRREKYAVNVLAFGEIVTRMVDKDMNYEDACDSLSNTLGEMIREADCLFGELLKDEEASQLFQKLFRGMFKLKQKMYDNSEVDLSDTVFIGVKDVQGRIIYSLNEYGFEALAQEILKDEKISKFIDEKYVKPIQGLLKEYIALFVDIDEEEYYQMFSELFIQSSEFLVYQALLNVLIVLAIDENINISSLLQKIDKNSLIEQCKEMILNIQTLDEYKEEITSFMKVLIDEQTQ